MEWYHIALIVLGSVLLFLLLCYLFVLWLTMPGRRKCGLDKYKDVKFAHRGLHGDGRAENSMSAFRAAKDAGFGIELDVRLSRDGELVVFHDPNLDRVCGVSGRVIDYTAEELSKMSLSGTDDGIPTFSEVLEIIDGAVPLLVEIKHDLGEGGVAEKLAEVIAGYKGDYIVESFNPLALRKVRQLMPDVPRGILSMRYSEEPKYKGKLLYFLLENMLLNFLMRPDFIAYEKTGHGNFILRRIRRKIGTPLFAWTVRSEEEEIKAVSDGFDSIIFEGYVPKK